MKVYIARDEWYPVYRIEDDELLAIDELDIPPETKQRWKIAEQCFRDYQDEIRAMIDDE